MDDSPIELDVLCVGAACYDLTYALPQHPAPDSKQYATDLISCGGGMAANAAVTAARLGYRSALIAQLGDDVFGDKHVRELEEAGVVTDFIRRRTGSTGLSTILAKADGSRSLIHFGENEQSSMLTDAIDFSLFAPKVILFDGAEWVISQPLARWAKTRGIKTILDGDSLYPSIDTLASQMDIIICSEHFAFALTGESEVDKALVELAAYAPAVVITLGAEGLIWQKGKEQGSLPAFKVEAIDSTGAGDAFHGAFAACATADMGWLESLRYASVVAALCCTKIGARTGIPTKEDVDVFLRSAREEGL